MYPTLSNAFDKFQSVAALAASLATPEARLREYLPQYVDQLKARGRGGAGAWARLLEGQPGPGLDPNGAAYDRGLLRPLYEGETVRPSNCFE